MSFITELQNSQPSLYHKATNHVLTNELCLGKLPDHVLYTYLVQDLKYFQRGLSLFGKALALCDDHKSAIRLGSQIGFLSADENTYFTKLLAELKANSDLSLVKSMTEVDSPTLPEVHSYLDAINELTYDCVSYPTIITFIYAMEKVYLEWTVVNQYQDSRGLEYKHSEWVALHSGDSFEEWVGFLEKEVVRVCTTEEAKKDAVAIWQRTLDLEVKFFNACYYYKD